MFVYMCVCVSQVISLAVKRYGVHLHVHAAGIVVHHPAYGSAVEGGSRTNVVLVHHRWLWLLLGYINVWQLEGHQLGGLLKASKGYGSPIR